MAKTVMVLGAGASWAYGFPTGATLIDEIALLCRRVGNAVQNAGLSPVEETFRSAVFQAMSRAGGQASTLPLRNFAYLIEGQMPTSIDWFLGQDFAQSFEQFKTIGLLAIAYQIGLAENSEPSNAPAPVKVGLPNGKPELREHWYKTFWQSLGIRQVDDFEQLASSGDLRIVTFNYDRSFDHFLYRRAHALHQAKHAHTQDADAQALVAKLDICHVYGSLGTLVDLPFGQLRRLVQEQAGFYEIDRILQACLGRLLAIEEHRQEQELAAFEKAQTWLRDADRVVFLGFGFDKENLRRLGFPAVGKHWHQLYATTFGVGPAQREDVLGQICKDLPLAKQDGGSLRILDEHHDLTISGYLHRYQPFAGLARR